MLVLATKGNRTTLGEHLKVTITAFPPDKRKRDLDNLLKAPLDALQFLYGDDSKICELTIKRGAVMKGSRCFINSEAQWCDQSSPKNWGCLHVVIESVDFDDTPAKPRLSWNNFNG